RMRRVADHVEADGDDRQARDREQDRVPGRPHERREHRSPREKNVNHRVTENTEVAQREDKERKQKRRESSGAPSNRGRLWLAWLGFSLFLCLLSVFSDSSVSSIASLFLSSLVSFSLSFSVLSLCSL